MTKQEFWKRCDPEMREFLLDCKELKELLVAFDGKVTDSVEGGVVPSGRKRLTDADKR